MPEEKDKKKGGGCKPNDVKSVNFTYKNAGKSCPQNKGHIPPGKTNGTGGKSKK